MDNIEPVWREYHARLHSFIRDRVGDPAAADDILQDVFVKIHSRIDTVEDSSRLQSWIYQITRHAIVDHYRARRPAEDLPEALAAPQPEPGEAELREMAGCVTPMIQSLRAPYSQALQLSEIEGWTQQEVADLQGISLSGAKSHPDDRALFPISPFDLTKGENTPR